MVIDFDHNATTRPRPEVLEEMLRASSLAWANPSSRHALGRSARRVLEDSRESIARILGAGPDEVVFTSGGTESNNLALSGLARGSAGTMLLTAGEHPSLRGAAEHLRTRGWRTVDLPVDSTGRLLEDLSSPFSGPDVRLAAVILAHNETGVIQNLAPLARMCQARGTALHVDAVQAVGKIPVHFHRSQATTMSCAAHKFYGPRGIGALLVRTGVTLTPLLHGGHQELDRRPGTEAVPLIAGMARALELWDAEQQQQTDHVRRLRDQLQAGLVAQCSPAVVNGAAAPRLPNTLNIAFPGVDGEALLVALDLAGIACSLGSACASGSAEPAPALIAMGCPPEVLRSSIRFSLGADNTVADVERALAIIPPLVTRLRAPPG